MFKKICSILAISFIIGVIGFNIIPKTMISNVTSIILYQSNEQLAKDSDVIVKGKVKELLPSKRENFVNKDGYNLDITYTDVVFEIDDTIKGIPYDKTIHIRINKGKVGDSEVRNVNIPNFVEGEECLLFLINDTTSYKVKGDNHYFINGTIQGKFVPSSTNDEFETIAPDHGKINLADMKNQLKNWQSSPK